MRVFILMDLGCNYSTGTHDDLIECYSIKAAIRKFEWAIDRNKYYPVVVNPTAFLFIKSVGKFNSSLEEKESYDLSLPDKEITVGKRGGIKVSRI